MNKPRPRAEIVAELIELITTAVNLQHIDKTRITENTSLMRPPPGAQVPAEESSGNVANESRPLLSLGLDSIDLLEAVVVVENQYGVKIENAETGEKIFKNFGALADHILAH